MENLFVSSSPHIRGGRDTSKDMMNVFFALLPASIFGVVIFGLYSLVVLLVSIASALLTEWLLEKQFTLNDGSALVTGLLIGMNMSPTIPIFIPILASVFAILVVKWVFGGLGCNWMNPALAGRAFVFFSFTSLMNSFKLPWTLNTADALSTATPLTVMKGTSGLSKAALDAINYPTSSIADYLSSHLGGSAYTYDAFLGNMGGTIGETSALLLLLGFFYLLIKKIVKLDISVSYLASFAILNYIFKSEALYPMLSGGLMLGALFMATDYVTSPTTTKGRIIFGVGCGFITFLIRNYGSLSESVSLAIIFMNIWTLSIDRWIKPRLFGKVKKNG